MTSLDQGAQRASRHLWRAEVDEIHRSAEAEPTRAGDVVSLAGGDPAILSHGLAALLVAHAIEHEHTVQVVEFVLVHARFEIVGLVFDDLAVHIDPAEQDGTGSHQLDVEAGDREAALVVHPFTRRLDDLWIENGSPIPIEIPDDNLLLHTDLRGGEGDTTVAVIQGVEHLLDQADRATVDIHHRGGLRLEHRVAEGSDLEAHRWQAT